MTEQACSLPAAPGEAAAALAGVKTIAVVGLSPRPDRPSHWIAKHLLDRGYQVIPIRPGVDEILGQKAYPSLAAYGKAVDMVNIFRQPDAVPGIVEQALKIGCKVIWMQEGVAHETAARQALSAGCRVVQNTCIYKMLHQLDG
ncbi:CoA-binding protein [candidate division FCPU426 bacterium]|nr:CoA-binding protein [candidate division FCPU426 bacterium]